MIVLVYCFFLITIQILEVNSQSLVEHDLLPSLSASCHGNIMTIQLETKQPFHGVLHVCDKKRNDCKRTSSCAAYGDGNQTASLKVNLFARMNDPDYCGILINDRNSEKSVPVAVRFHRNLLLAEDKFYVITCGRSAFRNSRNETVDGYMRLITDDGKRVSEAFYGRKYRLRVGVNNLEKTHGFRVVSCFAYGGFNSTVVSLFDKRGCPERRIAASRFSNPDVGWSETEFIMFRFADSNAVNIQCDMLICKGGCGDFVCEDDLLFPILQTEMPDHVGVVTTSYTFYVVDPGEQLLAVKDCSGTSPSWLLYLCITLGILFLIMLVINIFLCCAMSCTCSRAEVIEKEPSVIEVYDPYRSWQGSQYETRYAPDGKVVYGSPGSTVNSRRSLSTNNSDHYAIVHSAPQSRRWGYRQRTPRANNHRRELREIHLSDGRLSVAESHESVK